MTTYNKASLKTYFETNDVPTGTDYSNLIDSYVNIVETAIQTMAGPLYTTELITPNVSASTLSTTGATSLASLGVSGTTSAANVYADSLTTGTYIGSVAIVSAVGTTQATAAVISAHITRGQGATDGTDTGFFLESGTAGRVYYLINESAVSANLWPPVDGKINALATNAAYGLSANTSYTIIRKTTNSFAVK